MTTARGSNSPCIFIISGRTFDCMKQLRPPAGAGGRYLPADGGDVQSAETGRSEMTMKIAGRAIAYRKPHPGLVTARQ